MVAARNGSLSNNVSVSYDVIKDNVLLPWVPANEIPPHFSMRYRQAYDVLHINVFPPQINEKNINDLEHTDWINVLMKALLHSVNLSNRGSDVIVCVLISYRVSDCRASFNLSRVHQDSPVTFKRRWSVPTVCYL